MRSIHTLIFLAGALLGSAGAHSQTKLFYYYPSQNVYFSVDSRQYLFQKDGQWCQNRALPALVRVNKRERVCIISTADNVLNDSSFHKQVARTWEIKQKRGTDTTQYLLRIDRDRS